MTVRVEVARAHHIPLIVRGLRERDRAEIRAGWGEPEYAMLQAVYFSPTFARVAFWELEPLALFGMRPLSVLGGSAEVWCFGTEAIDRHRLAFLRASRSQVQAMWRRAPILTNYVDVNDAAALRWLAWLGARQSLPPESRGGTLFAQFFLTAPQRGAKTCQRD
jgi:hypothetical protein